MSKQAAEALKAELHEKRYITKRRMLGNIQFIGELYKKSMLKENVMKTCVEQLLNAKKEVATDRTLKALKFKNMDVDEDNLEALGKLIRTIGSTLDTSKNTLYMKEIFRLMDKIANNKSINSRMRFMIRDLEELRKHNWVPRRKQDKAKTLDDIRKEAEAEARGGGPPGPKREGLLPSRLASQALCCLCFRCVPPLISHHHPLLRPFFVFTLVRLWGLRVIETGGGAPRAAEAPMTLGAGRGDRKTLEQREGRSREGAAAAARLTEGRLRPTTPGLKVEEPSEKLVNKINGFVNEFVSEKDKDEALLSFDELPAGPIPETVSKIIIEKVLEGKPAERPARLDLLRLLASKQKLPQDALERTLDPMIEFITDIAVDSPNADNQKFSLPELFPQKADAVKYLEAEQLWAVHPGLWVTSILEPKLAQRQDGPSFLSWLQGTAPADVRKQAVFADQLAKSMLTADGGTAPSATTLQALEWVCKESSNSQSACLWGVYRFFMDAPKNVNQVPSQQTEDALARTFDKLLEKHIADKAALQAWYKQFQTKKEDSSATGVARRPHPVMEAFFKKSLLFRHKMGFGGGGERREDRLGRGLTSISNARSWFFVLQSEKTPR
ncbi:eukaryotic initiation factor 4G [Ectocarpus siliculosus]|uniref:Eukaryotic initiation factor 4G n=1 Tax=Ectocarpus siliculosus TaxID=2880 RepID=D7G664_ECTSI|nr:eukaryotic initiation factor 4G [Ectocarpus siliculosus]|eukprot:CBJ33927.1 eukaryotic initiation factor 4G [Ectocarpus siliculosus]